MTHTLHRLCPSAEAAGDWVVLAMSSRDVNRPGAAPKLRRFLSLALMRKPENFGIIVRGNGLTCGAGEILARVTDETICHAAFSSAASVGALLGDLKREELGLSVVLSGPFEASRRLADAAGLSPHTLSLSLGIWGDARSLAGGGILEIVSLCGHGLVSAALVERMAAAVRSGRLTPAQAGRELAGPCVCGVFNPETAGEALRRMTEAERPGTEACGPGLD